MCTYYATGHLILCNRKLHVAISITKPSFPFCISCFLYFGLTLHMMFTNYPHSFIVFFFHVFLHTDTLLVHRIYPHLDYSLHQLIVLSSVIMWIPQVTICFLHPSEIAFAFLCLRIVFL